MSLSCAVCLSYLFFQAEDGIRDGHVTGVQTCALPISRILHLIGGDVLTAGDSLVLTAPAGPPDGTTAASTEHVQIGRASCRERVKISEVADALNVRTIHRRDRDNSMTNTMNATRRVEH